MGALRWRQRAIDVWKNVPLDEIFDDQGRVAKATRRVLVCNLDVGDFALGRCPNGT